ncbi:MAG: hypothetical protein CME26_16105 [Gemmatimonadetes bacterium]|nr:hypothetical protein [Gemmatimonadota bacterium]
MKYLSVFSGIGGLEGTEPPVLLCESDGNTANVLNTLYPLIDVHPDIGTLEPPEVDVVAGGWPCQDLSIAGQQAGLSGLQSGLLLEMLRVSIQAKAHTVVAENVPNLLRLRNGLEFQASLEAFHEAGFPFVAWRMLNAREFGLPQNRSRILLVASKHKEITWTLLNRELPGISKDAVDPALKEKAAGFYWTAGTHSINYSRGYVPTIKIGSSAEIPSPPAVHYGDVIRRLSPLEALRLQGFDKLELDVFKSPTEAYKAAGNAVAKPIGNWVMDGLSEKVDEPDWLDVQEELLPDAVLFTRHPEVGMSHEGYVIGARVPLGEWATNLYDFLDLSSTERLSSRASSGLLRRLDRSGNPCPEDLRCLLEERAKCENGATADAS